MQAALSSQAAAEVMRVTGNSCEPNRCIHFEINQKMWDCALFEPFLIKKTFSPMTMRMAKYNSGGCESGAVNRR